MYYSELRCRVEWGSDWDLTHSFLISRLVFRLKLGLWKTKSFNQDWCQDFGNPPTFKKTGIKTDIWWLKKTFLLLMVVICLPWYTSFMRPGGYNNSQAQAWVIFLGRFFQGLRPTSYEWFKSNLRLRSIHMYVTCNYWHSFYGDLTNGFGKGSSNSDHNRETVSMR